MDPFADPENFLDGSYFRSGWVQLQTRVDNYRIVSKFSDTKSVAENHP